jgi:ABC-type branched-subunit amino acid transport system substrate-binding protein
VRGGWGVRIACLLLVSAALLASCSSKGTSSSVATSQSNSYGSGVTASTVKIGVALVNFSCIEQFVNQIRVNQNQVYDAFIKYVNTHGGIAGKKVVPDYQYFCPIQNAEALALCTKFTQDDHVFAVMGNFVDFSGDAQGCVAKDNHTVLMTFSLTQAILDQNPPGLIVYPGNTPERADKVMVSLLKKENTLAGKKVAVLGELDSEPVVNSSVVPGLKSLGVPMGSTAILDVTGADTSAAQSQLDSFIQRWKSEGVNALFVSGTQVSSQQFIEKVRAEMPDVLLMTDDQASDVLGYGQQERQIGRNPNPYEGIITVGGPTTEEYDNSANWKFCSSVYKQETGKVAPNAQTIVPGPNGKRLDTYGSINDACQLLLEFQEIGNRVGKYLNNANWVHAVNTYGTIRDYGAGQYASLHTGKYDDNDTFRLEKFVSSLGPRGDWQPITPLEDIPGS